MPEDNNTNTQEQRWEIKRSPAALDLKIKFFSIVYAIVAIIAISLLVIPFDLLDFNFILWGMIILFLVLVFYLLSLWYLKVEWKHTRYYISSHGLSITSGVGVFNEEVFRLESIISAKVSQGYMGNHFGYGDIVVDIPKLQDKSEVILRDVERPAMVLEDFREQIRMAIEKGGATSNMVV